MSYVISSISTSESIRMRLEILRNYQHSVVRCGEERLRVAMAEYAQHVLPSAQREAA